jgi:hypothetical protein
MTPNEISKVALDAAMKVHSILGVGLLEDLIIELRSVQQLAPIHKAQILTYLKPSKISLGLLLNFNSVHLRDGIVRVINS